MITIHDLYTDHLLLLSAKQPNKNWAESDSESLYKENLKTQSEDWYYRTHSITYKRNSNKYRCAEWNDITWSNSWIVLGCSSVEGIGLDESDVLSTRLSELLDSPVINLGVGGTGADVTLFNSIRLIDKNIRPKGVIIINGDFTLTRLSLFTSTGSIAIGNWSFDKKINQGKFSNLYSLWTNEAGHAETYSYMCLRGAISMWKTENIPTFYFNIERDLPKKSDLARDLSHWGRETIKLWARSIVNTIIIQ